MSKLLLNDSEGWSIFNRIRFSVLFWATRISPTWREFSGWLSGYLRDSMLGLSKRIGFKGIYFEITTSLVKLPWFFY